MKRVVFILSFVLLSIGSRAQREELTPPIHINAVLKTDYKGIEKGTPLVLEQASSVKNDGTEKVNGIYLVTTINNQKETIPIKKAGKLLELIPTNTEEFWLCEYLNHEMFKHYGKKGYRKSLRREVMSEADAYLNNLNGLFYKDAYIRDYIQTVFTDIAPRYLDKNRPERLNIEILQSPNPDAFMLSNGTLLISTGFLSIIDSADELTAIIASEMAHYALDHQVINVGKERARVRRAETWGVALSIAAMGAEILITENSDHYIPGGIMITAGATGAILSASAIRKLGMGYSDNQYFEADDIAVRFLKLNGMDPAALSSALFKIKSYYVIEKDDYALSRQGGYSNVDQRINRLDDPKEAISSDFRKKMSGVTTFNAAIQLNSKNYRAAERLAIINMKNRCATDEDYLILVEARMSYRNSTDDNRTLLKLVRQAKTLSPIPNLGLYKQEVLLLLRLDEQTEAADSLHEYISMLTDFKSQAENDDDIQWANEELAWGNKLHRQTRP